ncbi:ribose 5-phosphate isomerase B [candidate division KSB1 bacterium]|nr:MAG: ribose 5-phosphate isomerase B [candidate division KSB1 bacterium]
MKIILTSDHAGFELKEKIKSYLTERNFEVVDAGCNSKESVDYPDYGYKAAQMVSSKSVDRGILVCATGIGMSIVANKVKGIRAALVTLTEQAELTRKHNDSNILCLPGKFMDENTAKRIVDIWLNTEFEGGRHLRRINKIHNLTNI